MVIANDRATVTDLAPEPGKLEILGMFPPRTEAPTADKLALCYAPHVDMTTVIEVEVCFHETFYDSLCSIRSYR